MSAAQCRAPLAGVRVLEFGHVVSGPYCGMLLADLGADVVKVESPDRPDMLRGSGARDPHSGRSLAFETVNRGKRSLDLDLSEDADRELLDRLLVDTDVVIENYRPGVAERLGIGYARISALNPRIILASISGFGQSGPLSSLGGYDMIAQAMSGLMSVTGQPGRPTKIGVPVADIGSALYATIGVLSALRARDRCGHGQWVDCSLFDTAVSFGVWESAEFFATGRAPQPEGNVHRALAPYQPVRTADGWIVIAANTDDHFTRLVSALGDPEFGHDQRFASNDARVAHRSELAALIESITATATRNHWAGKLREAGVPCGEILDFGAALTHPQVVARDMVVELSDPDQRVARVLGDPVKLSHTQTRPGSTAGRTAPRLGEHREDLIAELIGPAGKAAG